MSTQIPAIILPARPTAFALLNCMRLARIPSTVFAFDRHGHEIRSHYASKIFLDETRDPDTELLGALDKLRERGGVILPSKDSHVLMLSRHRARLERDFALSIPSDELVLGLIDKALEVQLVKRVGFDLPPTETELPEDPRELIDRLGTTSVILKPRIPKSGYGMKTFHARNAAELSGIYESLEGRLGGLIAQAHIAGGAESLWLCNCVFNAEHDLVSAFIYRKRRTKPIHNGVTTVGVSEWNPQLAELARRFGKTLGYTGPADLEFKLDAATGRYYYIETNTRFTLSCEFAARCGANQAALSYWIAAGREVRPQVMPHSEGVYYTNLPMDLRARRKAGDSWAHILLETIPLFLRRRVGLVTFSPRDPWPYSRHALGFVFRGALFPPRWILRRIRSLAAGRSSRTPE